MIKQFFHWLSHKMGNNYGHVVTWEEDNHIWLGFECDTCRTIDPKTIDKIPTEIVLGKPIEFGDE